MKWLVLVAGIILLPLASSFVAADQVSLNPATLDGVFGNAIYGMPVIVWQVEGLVPGITYTLEFADVVYELTPERSKKHVVVLQLESGDYSGRFQVIKQDPPQVFAESAPVSFSVR